MTAPPPGQRPRRILSLDGGGIRGVFTLQILGRIEELLRRRSGRPDLVLADEFDLIAGTSTGAIIGAMLSWGLSVGQIERHYLGESGEMFTKSAWQERWKTKYTAENITAFFRRLFSEDGDGREPALLGTSRLRTLVLLIMRNATTGSAWPVSNNPAAVYNDRAREDCNLNVPLWQLVRASTAAPTYFPPEQIRLGPSDFIFIDGGITPYNNPSLIAFLMATLPAYRINWETGVDRLRLVSVGTGNARTKLTKDKAEKVHLLDAALHVIPALIQSIAVEQDLLCRVLGRCDWGETVDAEIGRLPGGQPGPLSVAERKFGYVRYDHRFEPAEESELRAAGAGDAAALDDLAMIPVLQRLGRKFALRNVDLAHLGG
jgi:patatin-like phospholipase/acyl hydrolase